MEKTGNLKYLKGVTIALLTVYCLFVFMNVLKGLWDYWFYFGNEEGASFFLFVKYPGRYYFWIYGLIYILEIIFLLLLNSFVKKWKIGRGYHILIVLLSFLPVINLFLFYFIKMKLNKQLFIYSGMKWNRSNWKIGLIWILMILLVLYNFVIIPFLMFYVNIPELVSNADYYSHFSVVVTDCYLLSTALIWFFYYLEFKRMLNTINLSGIDIRDDSLLDS